MPLLLLLLLLILVPLLSLRGCRKPVGFPRVIKRNPSGGDVTPGRSLWQSLRFPDFLSFSVTFRYLLSKPTVPLVAGNFNKKSGVGAWVVLTWIKSRGRGMLLFSVWSAAWRTGPVTNYLFS